MIARLAISPEALAEVSLGTERAAKLEHERLLKLVSKHGAIVFPDDDAVRAFLRFLRDPKATLPPGVGKRWEALLIAFLKGSRMWAERPPLSPPLRPSAELTSLGQSWAKSVDVVVVDADTGSALGVPESEGWLVVGESGLEIAYLDAVSSCDHISRLDQFQEAGHLASGASRELFWDRVLSPLWRTSKHVTLLDRYLLKGFWNGGVVEHVEWLLERMADASGVKGSVTLIAEAREPKQVDLGAVLDRLASICIDGRIGTLRVNLVPERPSGRDARMAHDRHIRFDTNAVSLGAGVDRLSRPTIWDSNGMNWQYRWAEEALSQLRAAEQRAAQMRGTRSAERTL